MLVKDLMTPSPHGLQVDQPVRQAAELMAKHNIGAVIVYDGPELAGIVTARDVTIRSTATGRTSDQPVGEVMTANPVTISVSASADEALQEMVERGIGRLCVVDGEFVRGIITFGDLSPLTGLIAKGLARTRTSDPEPHTPEMDERAAHASNHSGTDAVAERQ